MAQNYNIGNLGQKLTVDLAGNVVSLSTTVNAAAHTVGSSFVANTSQLTISGIPLSANGSTGTATYVLTSNGATGSPYWSSVTVGSSYVQNTDSRTLSGNLNFTGTNVYFTAANFGSIGTGTGGVVANVTTLFIGNNTVNAYLTTTGLNINAVTIANTTGVYTGIVNGSTLSVGTTFTANATLVNAAAINVVNQTNTATLYVTTSANVGTAVVANATGVYTTGTVNAASYTVGTAFISNSTAIVGTGYANVTTSVNSALLTVGTAFTANATLVNAAAINVVNQTNTATLYVTTSSNVASAVQSNSTGVWTTGTINAAAHTIGAGFVANTSVHNVNTDISMTVNNKQLRFATVNTSAYSYFINQNDDNFVLYTTNTAYGARAVFSIYANSITSNLNFAVRTVFNGGTQIPTGVTLLDSTGSQGTAGQVLTSNGASNVYWSTVSGGGGSGTVTSVATGNGMTGGTITTTGTVSVLANTGIVANATGTFVNATYIGTISSNNASYLGGTAAASYQLNSTLNANIASYLPIYTGVVNASAFTTTGNANAANFYSGANALFSAASIAWTGNTTTSPTITLANTGAFTIGNSTTTQTGGSILIANSIGNVAISVNQIGLGNTSSQLNLTSTSILMGSSGSTAATGQISVANSTGNVQITPGTTSILATGIINAASYTVGTSTVANSLGVYTGVVNGSTISVGTTFTANATLVNAAAINVVNQTNTATLYVTTSANVGTAVVANATGVYTTGTVNAASHTVGTAFTANATMTNTASLVVSTNTATIGTGSYFVSNGYIGINKSSPAYRLDLVTNTNGNDGVWFYNSNTGTSAQAFITVQTNGASGFSIGQGYSAKNGFIYLADNSKLELSTNATVAMTIAANSNIGIGTGSGSPKSPLVITPSTYTTSGISPPNKIRFFDDGANNVYGIGIGPGYMDINYAGAVRFNQINQTTNVASTFATVSGTQLTLNTTDGTNGFILAGASKAVRMYPSSVGTFIEGVDNTGVGSYQPLVLGGSLLQFAASGSEKMRMSAAGGFSVGTTADPGAGAIYATGNITANYSDKRLKDIVSTIPNALKKINSLSGIIYKNNDVAKQFGFNDDKEQLGVIAQEVQMVAPQAVKAAPFDLDENNKSKSGENYLTVQYEKLIPLLIESIKELTSRVNYLEHKLNEGKNNDD